MKRILLILLLLLSTTTIANAGLITLKVLSEDASIDDLNANFNILKNEFNGSIESANIAADTIAEVDMADEVNPAVREGDHFNAYTVTGHLPATSTAPNLFSDISAGTSYIKSDAGKLFRQVTTATSHTYTASRDTWVDIDINGTFQFTEVSLGAAEPSVVADSLRLAKVVTDSDNITSVSDERTLTVTLTTDEDFYLKGMKINCDNTGGEISADSGIVKHGTTTIGKTSFTNLTVSTAADWWDGNVDTGSAAFYYIGIDGDGNIKFLGDSPPDTHDTSGNTDPPFYYWDDGSTKWRVLGQVKVDASNNTLAHRSQGSRVMWDIPIEITTTLSDNAWSSALSCAAAIPGTSETGIFGLYIIDSGVATCGVWIKPNNGNWVTAFGGTQGASGIYDQASDGAATGQRDCFTDGSQQIQYANQTGDSQLFINVEGYICGLRD